MTLRRGFSVKPGERVLIAEDVVTTGGSVNEVADLVRSAGGEVVAAVSLIDRGGSEGLDVELVSALRLEVESWEPSECGLCAAGVPLEAPGSRLLER